MKIGPFRIQRPLLPLMLFISAAAAITLAGCSSSEEGGQSGSGPTVVNWSADGIISDGEYDKMHQYGAYQIHWSNDKDYIYVAMRAYTDGWVAVGFRPALAMLYADMVIGFVKDGQTTIYDMFSTGENGPHPPDVEQGGEFNILEYGGGEADGYTTIEFKRKLDTGDQYDKKLSNTFNIIWAFGFDDDIDSRHSQRGAGGMELD